MSASRGLAFWRLARAAPRAVSLAKLNSKPCPLIHILPLSNRTVTCSCPRLLSTQTNSGSSEDPPASGSDGIRELTSDAAEATSDPDPETSFDSDDPDVTSDPEMTSDSDDPDVTSDPEMTSDSDDPDVTSDPEITSDSDDPDVTSDPDDTRIEVLEAALLHVPSLGWTVAALEAGARDMGLEETIDDMFPREGGELIDHFEVQCNNNLLDYMKKRVEQERVTGAELLEDAVEHRLKMTIPFINKWPQAMALKAFPTNAPTALENLALMVDDIWYSAGDRSTDFNWYTKRGLLATIYTSTEVFLVQDTSVDFQDTWSFLRHRMQDASTVGKATKEFQGVVSGGCETMAAGFNAALNMLGMNRSR